MVTRRKRARGARFAGATALIALLWSPVAAAQPGERLHDWLGVVPADATAVVVINNDGLADLSPLLPREIFVGAESVMMQAIDQTIASYSGMHVAGVEVWVGFMGFDDDVWALAGLGPVTGTLTAVPSGTYRGSPIVELGSGRSMLYANFSAEGFVVGTLEGVTGVLDTVAGTTVSLKDVPGALGVLTESDPEASVLLVARPEALEAFHLESLTGEMTLVGAMLTMSPTRTIWTAVMTSPAEAATFTAGLNLMLASSRQVLAQLDQAAADADDPLERLGMTGLRVLVEDALSNRINVNQAGNLSTVEVVAPPALAWAGSIAVPAVMAFQGYAMRSRTTEATMNVRRLFDSSVSYYDSDHATAWGEILPPQFPASVPRTPAEVPCGVEVDANYDDWEHPTWEALNFSVRDRHRYSYQYDSEGTFIGATFTASAFGDLDCDGVYSTFVRTGIVEAGNEIRAGAGLYQHNETE